MKAFIHKSALAVFAGLACCSVLFAQDARYDCPRCEDTGKVGCSACKNDRYFWCDQCKRRSACSVCEGPGWILCPECGGQDAKAERRFLLEGRKEPEKIGEAVGTKLHSIETPRFRLLTDIDHRKSHRYALLLEAYSAKLNIIFGNAPDDKIWKGKCVVYLFQPRDAFVKFAVTVDGKPEVAASGGYSCPSPDKPLIVLFKESRTDDDAARTIIHELAHVHLDAYHEPGPIPRWVHEGVAQRFEFFHKVETSRRKESLKLVKKALDDNRLMPLTELAEMKFGPAELLPYAAAWSAIDFLMASNNEAFVTWIKLMKDGEDQHSAFEAAFGASLAEASRAWQKHVRQLK